MQIGQSVGNIHRNGGFADAALHIHERNYLHFALPTNVQDNKPFLSCMPRDLILKVVAAKTVEAGVPMIFSITRAEKEGKGNFQNHMIKPRPSDTLRGSF